jgi:UDP-glucuronate 4-epimerase
MQAGDVKETAADISLINRDFGFSPKTSLEEGVPKFIEWYRGYRDGDFAQGTPSFGIL